MEGYETCFLIFAWMCKNLGGISKGETYSTSFLSLESYRVLASLCDFWEHLKE